MMYDFIQMNSLAIVIVVVLVATALIGAIWWIGWHPHPTVF